MNPARLLLSLLLLAPAAFAAEPAAATANPTPIPRLEGTIAIDGVLDEAAWQQAATMEIGYEISPADNTPAPVRTIMRMGYTRDALYMSFHAWNRTRRRSAPTSPTATAPSRTTSSG